MQQRAAARRPGSPSPRAWSSPSNGIRNCTSPDAGSPVQVPIQRASRSGSVTAAQTSSMGARNSRVWTRTCCLPRCSIRPVGVVMRSPRVGVGRARGSRAGAAVAGGPADLGLQGVQGLRGVEAPGGRAGSPASSTRPGRAPSGERVVALAAWSVAPSPGPPRQQPQVLADRRPRDRPAAARSTTRAGLRPARPAASGVPGRRAPRRCPRKKVTIWLPIGKRRRARRFGAVAVPRVEWRA